MNFIYFLMCKMFEWHWPEVIVVTHYHQYPPGTTHETVEKNRPFTMPFTWATLHCKSCGKVVQQKLEGHVLLEDFKIKSELMLDPELAKLRKMTGI